MRGFSAAQCDLSQPGRSCSCPECGSTVQQTQCSSALRRGRHAIRASRERLAGSKGNQARARGRRSVNHKRLAR